MSSQETPGPRYLTEMTWKPHPDEQSVISFVISRAKEYPEISRIILYGSRARRDHRERSDYDIAVEAKNMTFASWSVLAEKIREEVPTLCGLDLLKLDENTSLSLIEAIHHSGLILYEKQN